MTSSSERYKEHVDRCEQCGAQPFNLCDMGFELLFGNVQRREPREPLGSGALDAIGILTRDRDEWKRRAEHPDLHQNCTANIRDLQGHIAADGRRIASLLRSNDTLRAELARLKDGICLAGWTCGVCRGFVGEEKEAMGECQHCGSPKGAVYPGSVVP